jgi:dienelactone hydrolase
MAEVLLFHHALGLTPGVVSFADELRAGGHTVHAPDLFEGNTFGSIKEGMTYAEEHGFPEAYIDRGAQIAEDLPDGLVYLGFSLGVVPAQKLATTRKGARGAVLFYSFVPTQFFGPWPKGVPAQIHMHDADPLVVDEGDLKAAQEVADSVGDVELFLYPGHTHYFADSTTADYDEKAATLAKERVLAFLTKVAS